MPLRSALLWLGLAPATAPQVQVPEPPPGEPELRWSAPPGCPDRTALLAGIERRRGRPLVAGEVEVDAKITRTAGPRFVLHLRVRAGTRTERRSLAADTCAPLADATALVITLAVDAAHDAPLPPGVVTTPEDPQPVTPIPDDGTATPPATTIDPHTAPAATTIDPRTTTIDPRTTTIDPRTTPVDPDAGAPALAVDPHTPDTVDPPRDPAPTPTPRTRARRPGGLVRLHGGLERGAVPGFSGDVGLAFGLLWPRWRLELTGDFIAPRTANPPQATLRASLLAAGLHGCARLGRGALEFPICGGLELGGMRGVARGPGVDRTGTGLWFAGVLGVGLAWRFHPRLALWAALQGRLAVRPSFQLRDPGPAITLFEPWLASARLLLGLELRLGDRR